MYIQTITSSERDSEVCVSCPNACCPAGGVYFDPRPGHCCEGCELSRRSGLLTQCPNCGPQVPTGDVEWLDYLSGELTLAEMRHKIGLRESEFYRRKFDAESEGV
jgi:hypothetical protein